MTEINRRFETHKEGIQAAINAFYHKEADSGEEEMENVIKAYLSASNTVLVPREPTPEMVERMGLSYLTPDEAKSSLKYVIAAAPDPFRSKP